MLLHSLMTCADHKLDMEYIQLIICLVRLFRKHPDTAEAEGKTIDTHRGEGGLKLKVLVQKEGWYLLNFESSFGKKKSHQRFRPFLVNTPPQKGRLQSINIFQDQSSQLFGRPKKYMGVDVSKAFIQVS